LYKNIGLKFGCKGPSTIKAIAFYSTTTELILAHC